MSYFILGPLEVRDGENDVALRGGHPRKLLAILLLHSGQAVSSDRLIEELWDGQPPDTAAKALQGHVSSLRKQLGPETVETVGAGYRLQLAPEDLDAHRFEKLLTEAHPLEPAPAAVMLREALALWRGPALADFAYDDFAQNEIDRLEELRLVAIERRIELELALGHHDALVAELEALVHAHPLRERLRGLLMVALYRSGRQAEALDVYRDARTALRDELGLEPSEELQALQRSILDHDPALAPPPRVDLPRAPEDRRPPESRKLRRPLLAVALGLAILGGVAAALALTLGSNKTASIVVPPNRVAMIDASGEKVESYVQVGRRPAAIAVGLGGVWVANSARGTVTRLNPATGKFVDTIPAGGGDVSDIAVGFRSVWVANGNDGTVTKIDPRLDEGAAIQLGPQTLAPDPVFYIAVDSHHIWATRGNQLLRIDPYTRHFKVWANVESPTGLTTGGGHVWVTTGSGSLLRIDPSKPNTLEPQPVGAGAFPPLRAPVYARGSVWLIVGLEIQKIDPGSLSGSPLAVPAGLRPKALAWGSGALWSTGYGGRLTRLNTRGRPARYVYVGGNLTAVAAGGGATWVAVSAPG